VVAGERLVRSLPVEHDGEPRLLRRAHDEPLRDDRRRSERLVLRAHDRREHVDELARAEGDPVRLRAGAVDDGLGVRPLVEAALLEERGERALLVADRSCVLGLGAEQVVDRAHDRRRVDAARKARADRDVASQAEADGVEEELAHLLRRVRRFLARLERPVPREP
jgi:hypothetical protein